MRLSDETRTRAEQIIVEHRTAKLAEIAALTGLPHATAGKVRLALVRRGVLRPLREEQEAEQVQIALERAAGYPLAPPTHRKTEE